jgi:hypothetical protein
MRASGATQADPRPALGRAEGKGLMRADAPTGEVAVSRPSRVPSDRGAPANGARRDGRTPAPPPCAAPRQARSGPMRRIWASKPSATIKPVSSGSKVGREIGIHRPEKPVAPLQIALPLAVRAKSARQDLHSTTQISPVGPSAITSTRRPRAGTSSVTQAKSRVSRCRHTPRASRWPGARSVAADGTRVETDIAAMNERSMNEMQALRRGSRALSLARRVLLFACKALFQWPIPFPRGLALPGSWPRYLAPT